MPLEMQLFNLFAVKGRNKTNGKKQWFKGRLCCQTWAPISFLLRTSSMTLGSAFRESQCCHLQNGRKGLTLKGKGINLLDCIKQTRNFIQRKFPQKPMRWSVGRKVMMIESKQFYLPVWKKNLWAYFTVDLGCRSLPPKNSYTKMDDYLFSEVTIIIINCFCHKTYVYPRCMNMPTALM